MKTYSQETISGVDYIFSVGLPLRVFREIPSKLDDN